MIADSPKMKKPSDRHVKSLKRIHKHSYRNVEYDLYRKINHFPQFNTKHYSSHEKLKRPKSADSFLSIHL